MTATSFGGAVKIAALPKRIGNSGVVARGEGVIGLNGPFEVCVCGRDGRPFAEDADTLRDRRGVTRDEVDLPKALESRGRGTAGETDARPFADAGGPGESITVGDSTNCVSLFSTPSFHCKCRITDFVAH